MVKTTTQASVYNAVFAKKEIARKVRNSYRLPILSHGCCRTRWLSYIGAVWPCH